MTFNVQEMLSSVAKSGIAKTSHFEVQCTGPTGLYNMERDMIARADTAEMPGRAMATIDHKFANMGPMTKIPYSQTITDVTVSFILSEDMREKQYFEIWQEFQYNTGAFESVVATGMSKFKPKYYDNYTGTVTIRQFGSNGELETICNLMDAYPIIISPIGFNWGDEGVAKMNVTFAYRYYRMAFNMQDQPKRGVSGGLSIGRGGVKGNINIPGLGNIGLNNGRLGGNLNVPLQTPLGPLSFRIRK